MDSSNQYINHKVNTLVRENIAIQLETTDCLANSRKYRQNFFALRSLYNTFVLLNHVVRVLFMPLSKGHNKTQVICMQDENSATLLMEIIILFLCKIFVFLSFFLFFVSLEILGGGIFFLFINVVKLLIQSFLLV